MTQDVFAIAQEHHRAGRLTAAEAGYRQAIALDAAHAEARHWLGVLLFQAGQVEPAIQWLASAAELSPNDPALLHNLGKAYLAAGKTTEAVEVLRRAAEGEWAADVALLALGAAYLGRGAPGDASAAVAALQRAVAAGSELPELAYYHGVALLSAGRPADAVASLQRSLARKQRVAESLLHLGYAQRLLGDARAARKSLIKSLEEQPAQAAGWSALAMLDAEAGKVEQAAGLFRRAISADRFYLPAYQGLAALLKSAGKPLEADAVLQQMRTARKGSRPPTASPATSVAEREKQLTPSADQSQAHFGMAVLMNVFAPTQVPDEAVARLFDRYAPTFDQHLTGTLEYRVPQRIAEAVRQGWDGAPLTVLDLGCGTGLCGPLLRPMAGHLGGVDLSQKMIDQARARGVYDELVVANLLGALRDAPGRYDLLVAADVLIYLGDLSPAFEAATAALRPGGRFIFSVEAGHSERFALNPASRRYAHSADYLRHLATIFGLHIDAMEEIVIRKEAEAPVAGFLLFLRRPN